MSLYGRILKPSGPLPTLVAIDYGMGNLRSVQNALELLGFTVEISADPDRIARADAVVLPGVGAFGQAMENLRERSLIDVLTRRVMEDGTPFLGICLGMQLIAEDSQENGAHNGLGWLKGHVVPFKASQIDRVPHVGWSQVYGREETLFAGLDRDACFYFDHCYYLDCPDAHIAATCDAGGMAFTAAVRAGNVFATQFHPEKSQRTGLRLLRNFTEYCRSEFQGDTASQNIDVQHA